MKKSIFSIVLLFTLAASAHNWNQIASNTSSNLKTIAFPSASIGYIGGSDSVLLKSIDGGQTWQRLALNNVIFGTSDKTVRHIDFINDTLGYLIVDSPSPSGLMYQTTDGGLTWTKDLNLDLCLPKASFFFDANNGIAVGAGCFSGETVDRLVNGLWQGQQALNSFDPSDELLAVDFINPNFGMAAGNSAFIFRTVDGGLNWDTIRPIITDSFIVTDILIVDDTLSYATFTHKGSTGGVLITTDGGLSWKEYSDNFTFQYQRFHSVTITESGNVFFGGLPALGNGIIQYRFGNFWPIDQVDQPIKGLATYGDSTVFAVGDSGYIIVNRDPLFISVEDKPTSPSFKCYPNPVLDELIIELKAPQKATLNLMDLQGRNLLTQVNNEMKTSIDFRKYLAGVYLVSITTSSGIYTKKVIKTNAFVP